jgi:UDP-galactose transporter B1
MSSSNESLGHVSYPTAVLAKSSKLIPTMLVGFFYERKSFAKEEWYSAALITGGIISFNLSRMSSNEKKGSDSMYGLFLLFLSLVMDGFLASFQGMLKNNDKRERCRAPMAIENMLWINLYALVFFLPLSIYSGQFSNGVGIFNPSSNIFTTLDTEDKGIHEEIFSIQRTIIRMNLTAAVGQIFIFLTVQFFSPLMCTTITTTRKFMTILLSVYRYGHHFTNVQWGSVIGVFGGLYLAIASKLIVGNSTKKLN